MKQIFALFLLSLLSVLVGGCVAAGVSPPVTALPPIDEEATVTVVPTASPAEASDGTVQPSGVSLADVLYVRATQAQDSSWTFAVTVQHPDSGWDNYADGWDVITPDGVVLLPIPTSSFTRLLEHPHVEEQPFTRSQSGIVIPPQVTSVRVRAHSLVGGYGGREVIVDLNTSKGDDYEVKPLPPVATPSAATIFPNSNGNRLAAGKGGLPLVAPLDIPLAAQPLWLTGLPTDSGSLWTVAFADGQMQGFRITAGAVTEEFSLQHDAAPTMPPRLQVRQGKPQLFTPPADADSLSMAVPLPGLNQWIYVAKNGDLVIWADGDVARLAIQALPDTHILVDEQSRLLLFAKPTTRYPHAILGDTLEPSAVLLIETIPILRVITTIELADPQVIEGLAPLWVDIDGDGQREIVVTVSDANIGAQVVVYDESGKRQAAGQAIGQGFRWRHQIAIAPFAPTGELEFVEVLTPHIGGIVQFSRRGHDQLEVVAQIRGFTAHQIGSRNLDMAVAGDFDGDGRLELLIPDNGYQNLGAIQRSVQGADLIWTLPIGAPLTTNLATVTQADGAMAVGLGRADNILRLWLP